MSRSSDLSSVLSKGFKTPEIAAAAFKSKYSDISMDEINTIFNKFSSGGIGTGSTGSGGGIGSTILSKVSGGLATGVNAVLEGFKTQELQTSFSSYEDQVLNITDLQNILINGQGKFNSGWDITKNLVSTALSGMATYWKDQSALLTKINTQTGLTGELSKDYREELTNAYPRLIQLGLGMGDLAEAATNLVTQTGKFGLINQQTWEDTALTATAYVGTLSEMVGMFPEFEKVGYGAADATKAIDKAGKSALNVGLSSQKLTKDLRDNLGELNKYGFKNGVQGLSEMTRKAVEFRTAMKDTMTIADKVWSPEGAIDLSANLQVLGGAIGDFNDPLKLMYMATNNVEGLQDALIGAAGGLATYNREQGRFEVSGINLRRAKEMADQFGMSLEDLNKTAIATQERLTAASDLRGLNISKENREFITNIAMMKDGKMSIELQSQELRDKFGGATSVAVKDLSQANAELLLAYQEEFKKLTSDEIVRNQATSITNIERDVGYITAMMKVQLTNVAKTGLEKIGIDFKKIAEYTHGKASGTAEGIKNIGDSVIKYMDESNKTQKVSVSKPSVKSNDMSEIMANAANNLKQMVNPTVQTNSKLRVEIIGDVNGDKYREALLNNPGTKEKFVDMISDTRSYL